MGALERTRAGRPARLTKQVQDDIIASVRTGCPVHRAARYVWVTDTEMRAWRREADAALHKPRRQRTSLERSCVEFFAKLHQAQAVAYMRWHMEVAKGAGMTRERPKRRRTVQRILSLDGNTVAVDDEGRVTGGRVVEVQVIEEELAPDPRMLKLLAEVSFPDELRPVQEGEEWGTTPPSHLSDETLLRILVAAGQRAGVAPEEPIDAEVVDDQPALGAGEDHEDEPATR